MENRNVSSEVVNVPPDVAEQMEWPESDRLFDYKRGYELSPTIDDGECVRAVDKYNEKCLWSVYRIEPEEAGVQLSIWLADFAIKEDAELFINARFPAINP